MSEKITVKFNNQTIELHPSWDDGEYQSHHEYFDAYAGTKCYAYIMIKPAQMDGVYDGFITTADRDYWLDGEGNVIHVIGVIGSLQDVTDVIAEAYNERLKRKYKLA